MSCEDQMRRAGRKSKRLEKHEHAEQAKSEQAKGNLTGIKNKVKDVTQAEKTYEMDISRDEQSPTTSNPHARESGEKHLVEVDYENIIEVDEEHSDGEKTKHCRQTRSEVGVEAAASEPQTAGIKIEDFQIHGWPNGPGPPKQSNSMIQLQWGIMLA